MLNIKKSNLKVKHCFDDGSEKVFSLNLNDIDMLDGLRSELRSIVKKLRTLKEIEINLIATIDLIQELETINSKGMGVDSFSNKNEALFAMATALYSACFLKDHDKIVPISVLDEKIIYPEIHYKIRDFRDKRLCHLDEDHDVRSNRLSWLFEIKQGNKLRPIGADFESELAVFSLGEENQKWINFINILLIKSRENSKSLEKEINVILSSISIKDLD